MQRKKKNSKYIKVACILLFICSFGSLKAQDNVIDQIVATIGDKIVLKSDVENEMMRVQSQDIVSTGGNIQSDVLENLLVVKLMVDQAKIDSIEVTESEVEESLDNRMQEFIRQAGSRKTLEEYFKKPIEEIKNEFRDATREYILTQRLQNEIVKDVKVTPFEIRAFARSFNADSLPVMPSKLQIQQIVRYPKIKIAERERIRGKLRDIRDRVLKGESFASLAVINSEDIASSIDGGELGYTSRASLVEEFANVAFNLKPGKISKIVETEFGFHIMQMIDRKGDKVNVRHILIKPRFSQEERQDVINFLDTVAKNINNGKYRFGEAVLRFSHDKNTVNNNGIISSPYTGAYMEKTQLPPSISQKVELMTQGIVSAPFYDNNSGRDAFKIIRIVEEIPEHKANLNEDWNIFFEMLLAKKKQEVLDQWIRVRITETYIQIDDVYKDYKMKYKWTQ